MFYYVSTYLKKKCFFDMLFRYNAHDMYSTSARVSWRQMLKKRSIKVANYIKLSLRTIGALIGIGQR